MTRGARKEGLSRRHRFSGRGSFAHSLRSPRKVRGSLAILHIASGTPGSSRFGISIPKRVAPSSVDRNRLKRIAREIFRRHLAKGAGLNLVLFPKGPIDAAGETAWAREVGTLLSRAMGGQ